jgi:hypothetical protein
LPPPAAVITDVAEVDVVATLTVWIIVVAIAIAAIISMPCRLAVALSF